MMFQLDTAVAAELIALVLGTGLLVLVQKWEVKCLFSKIVGVFVIIVSILSLVCTTYYGLRYRAQGYFRIPYPECGCIEKEKATP